MLTSEIEVINYRNQNMGVVLNVIASTCVDTKINGPQNFSNKSSLSNKIA